MQILVKPAMFGDRLYVEVNTGAETNLDPLFFLF